MKKFKKLERTKKEEQLGEWKKYLRLIYYTTMFN